MKKLLGVLIIGFVLGLTACSEDSMSGETTTTCTDATLSSFANFGVRFGTIVIEGYDEEIRTWTERIEMNRDVYINTLWDGIDHGNEIIELWFITYSQVDAHNGITINLISLDDDTIVFELVYDYTLLSPSLIRESWNVDDVSDLTLSSIIRGLEIQRPTTTCTTN